MSELFCCVLGYNNTVGKVSAQAKCPNQQEQLGVLLLPLGWVPVHCGHFVSFPQQVTCVY